MHLKKEINDFFRHLRNFRTISNIMQGIKSTTWLSKDLQRVESVELMS